MRRLMVLGVVILTAALAWAEAPRPRPEVSERVRQLRRNQPLVREVVAGALSLAAEDDALKRADGCTRLAECLADEIERAALEQREGRAAELADHLHRLLTDAVAGLLSRERGRAPLTSVREQELRRLDDRVTRILRPVEARLRQTAADGEPMRRALRVVEDGRAEVEKASR